MAPASVSMCPASEIRAREEAMMPTTTSTTMKPTSRPSPMARQRRPVSWLIPWECPSWECPSCPLWWLACSSWECAVIPLPSPRLAGPSPEPVVLVSGFRRDGVYAVSPALHDVEDRTDVGQAEDPHKGPRAPHRLG